MGNGFGEMELFKRVRKLGLFLRQSFAKYKFLDYLGSPEKD